MTELLEKYSTLGLLHDLVSANPYQFDLPLTFALSDELLTEVQKPLDTLKIMQRIVDSTYTHDQYVELAKSNPGMFNVYSGPMGKVDVAYNYNNTDFEYIFMHSVIVDREKIINLICDSINVTRDYLLDRTIKYNNDHISGAYPDVMRYLYISPKYNLLYHTHVSGLDLNDSTNFLISVSGSTILKTSSDPRKLPYQEDIREINELVAINNKKFHTGITTVDDTFLFYYEPKLSFFELAEHNEMSRR